jgi:hypothetical protein
MTRNVATKQFIAAKRKKSSGEYPPPGPSNSGGIAQPKGVGIASTWVDHVEEIPEGPNARARK